MRRTVETKVPTILVEVKRHGRAVLEPFLLEKELLVEMCAGRLAEHIKNVVFSFLNLFVEVSAFGVFDQCPVLVAHIGLPKDAVLLLGFVGRLIPTLGDLCSIELLRSICRRHHVDDGIVPIVSQDVSAEAQVIQDCIPLIDIDVGRPIEQSPIYKDYDILR